MKDCFSDFDMLNVIACEYNAIVLSQDVRCALSENTLNDYTNAEDRRRIAFHFICSIRSAVWTVFLFILHSIFS